MEDLTLRVYVMTITNFLYNYESYVNVWWHRYLPMWIRYV